MTAGAPRPSRTHAYRDLVARLRGRGPGASLQDITDAAWAALRDTGVSWLGFYRFRPDHGDLELVASRDRPACSPIGLHGVCGQAHRTGRTRVVPDVAHLGDAYVACDPDDRSEIVVPVSGPDAAGRPATLVLDLDSTEVDAFSDEDDRWLRTMLSEAGMHPIEAGPPIVGALEETGERG